MGITGSCACAIGRVLRGCFQVCVPIDPSEPEAFDPDAVPTVQSLLTALDRSANPGAGWRDTAMADAVRDFERLFLEGMREECSAALLDKTRQAVSAPKVDF